MGSPLGVLIRQQFLKMSEKGTTTALTAVVQNDPFYLI
jgi:hypothetical protein